VSNNIDLNALGITPEDLIERVADKLSGIFANEEKDYAHDFEARVERAVKARVEAVLEKALADHILPKVAAMVDGIMLQETNKWGEKRREKLSVTEYLVERADAYIREEVDYSGKPKGTDSYSWTPRSTRIVHLIHEHLDWHIKKAMEKAFGDVTSSVRKGLEEAAKIAIDSIKVTVATKVEAK
jgi:hypothetical protein